jgi:hypothetical protein
LIHGEYLTLFCAVEFSDERVGIEKLKRFGRLICGSLLMLLLLLLNEARVASGAFRVVRVKKFLLRIS